MPFAIRLHLTPHPTNHNFQTKTNQTKFTSCSTKFSLKPAYNSNPLVAFVGGRRKIKMQGSSGPGLSIRSSLIDPDGGVLVDLVVPESERGLKLKEAQSMPRVKLTKIDLEWVHVISEGWASPLRGFMREDQYLQSLHFNSLKMENGTVVNMSLPIVLAIDDETKEGIGSSKNVGLIAPDGDLIGILRRYA